MAKADYTSAYKALVVPNPTDVADGNHSVASLEGFLEGSRESRDSACESSGTSVFDTDPTSSKPSNA